MPVDYDKYIKVSDEGTRKNLADFNSITPNLIGKKILDVGCGTGILLEKFIKNNACIGIDSNNASLVIVAKKGIITKLVDLEKKLPFKDNEFDLVICKDVLEFIFSAELLLNELARITKKGGTLLLHVPNEFNFFDLTSLLFGKGILKTRWYEKSTELNNPHLRFFTSKKLAQYVAEKGFVVTDYSWKWAFRLPLIHLKLGLLSSVFPRFFSPGITLLCTKK